MADIKKIKIGSTTYNIKDAVSTWGIGGTTTTLDHTLTASQVLSELGLTAAMHFIGAATGTSTAPTAGNYIKARTGSGANDYQFIRITTDGTATEKEAQLGDVFSVGSKEYVCTKAGLYNSTESSSNMFVLLGDEGSYALNTISVTGTGELGGGGTLTQDRTITHKTHDAVSLTSSGAKVVVALASNGYGHLTSASQKTISNHTYTPVGTNAASSVTLSGGSTSKLSTTTVHNSHGLTFGKKLSTTSITPVGGTDTVHDTPTLVYGKKFTTTTVHDTPTLTTANVTPYTSKTTKYLHTTSITPVGGTGTVHDTPSLTYGKKLETTTVTGVSGSTTTHDTPTLNKSKLDQTLVVPSYSITSSNLKTGSVRGVSSTATSATLVQVPSTYTLYSAKYGGTTGDDADTLLLEAVTLTDRTTLAVRNSSSTTVVTGIDSAGTGGAIVTGVTGSTPISVATGSLSTSGTGSEVGISLTAGSAVTVPTAASSATTVATGGVVNIESGETGTIVSGLTAGTSKTFATAGTAKNVFSTLNATSTDGTAVLTDVSGSQITYATGGVTAGTAVNAYTGTAAVGSGETGVLVSGLTAGTSKTFATAGYIFRIYNCCNWFCVIKWRWSYCRYGSTYWRNS